MATAAASARSMEDRAADEIRAALTDIAARGSRRAEAAGPEIAELWSIATDSLRGGKLVRPLLLLETVAAVEADGEPGCSPREEVVRAAAAVELLHCAFLLHDDVIDEDTTRRGRDNLIGAVLRRARAADGEDSAEQALHFSRSAAILTGDLMLTASHLLLARLDVEPARRAAVLNLLEEATIETVSGELLDVAFADEVRTADLDAVLDMTAKKTAAYTVEMPLCMAVVLAGRPDLDEPMRRAGRHLGLAYQLQDDLLSAFGDPSDHGKDPISDLREGKQTALIALARETPAWGAIAKDLGRRDLTTARADAMRRELERCGARAAVERLVVRELDAARTVLAESPAVPATVARVLGARIDRLEHRVS